MLLLEGHNNASITPGSSSLASSRDAATQRRCQLNSGGHGQDRAFPGPMSGCKLSKCSWTAACESK